MRAGPLPKKHGSQPQKSGTHTPRKRFGQNFLIAPGIITAILNAIAPQDGDTLVEIGPGLGALTAPLLHRLSHLHVIEIDRDLIARLGNQYPPQQLSIHAGDALKFDFAALGASLRIVGNLPYNISTPLLFHLLHFSSHIRDMHFMLQKEVVDRMVAQAGDGAYGRLSVMLQYYCHLEKLLEVPPESFNPPPKVDSAVVRLIPKPPEALTARSPDLLSQVVTQAFSQRRKMLRNTLKGLVSEEILTELGIEANRRAEELPLERFVEIANHLSATTTGKAT